MRNLGLIWASICLNSPKHNHIPSRDRFPLNPTGEYSIFLGKCKLFAQPPYKTHAPLSESPEPSACKWSNAHEIRHLWLGGLGIWRYLCFPASIGGPVLQAIQRVNCLCLKNVTGTLVDVWRKAKRKSAIVTLRLPKSPGKKHLCGDSWSIPLKVKRENKSICWTRQLEVTRIPWHRLGLRCSWAKTGKPLDPFWDLVPPCAAFRGKTGPYLLTNLHMPCWSCAGILTFYTWTLPCKWWLPFILVEKAMFQICKMYLLSSPDVEHPFAGWKFTVIPLEGLSNDALQGWLFGIPESWGLGSTFKAYLGSLPLPSPPPSPHDRSEPQPCPSMELPRSAFCCTCLAGNELVQQAPSEAPSQAVPNTASEWSS